MDDNEKIARRICKSITDDCELNIEIIEKILLILDDEKQKQQSILNVWSRIVCPWFCSSSQYIDLDNEMVYIIDYNKQNTNVCCQKNITKLDEYIME
jgi:hypothetical protein